MNNLIDETALTFLGYMAPSNFRDDDVFQFGTTCMIIYHLIKITGNVPSDAML